jgi:hypothetical protein
MVEKRARKSGINLKSKIVVQGEGFDDVKDFVKKLIFGRREYSATAQKYLVDNFYTNVVKLEIRKNPLNESLLKFGNYLTNGDLNDKMEQDQDNFYHISMAVELENGVKMLVEKTENVIIYKWRPLEPNEQKLDVFVNKPLGFGEMMEKTRVKYGDKIFFHID